MGLVVPPAECLGVGGVGPFVLNPHQVFGCEKTAQIEGYPPNPRLVGNTMVIRLTPNMLRLFYDHWCHFGKMTC